MQTTYWERRQAALFKAAAALYDVASAILNDCTLPAEFRGDTYAWAKGLARETANKAQALKEQALEEGPVVRQPRAFNAAQRRYMEAVVRHARLRHEYTAGDPAFQALAHQAGRLDGGR